MSSISIIGTGNMARAIGALAVAAGAVSLAQGFPDFPCPPELKDAASAAIHEDLNQYAITWGATTLREAIASSTVRHFPARENLVEAAYLDGVEEICAAVGRHADEDEAGGPFRVCRREQDRHARARSDDRSRAGGRGLHDILVRAAGDAGVAHALDQGHFARHVLGDDRGVPLAAELVGDDAREQIGAGAGREVVVRLLLRIRISPTLTQCAKQKAPADRRDRCDPDEPRVATVTAAALSGSTLTPSSVKPSGSYLVFSWASSGISWRQGPHHVAQKLIITTWPFKSASRTLPVSTSSIVRFSRASCVGSLNGRSSGSRLSMRLAAMNAARSGKIVTLPDAKRTCGYSNVFAQASVSRALNAAIKASITFSALAFAASSA